MPGLFRVESNDIKQLNSLQLTKLLKLLLRLEARSNGITERAVEVALNITVADGGEDGRIKWNSNPTDTDFLPSNFIQFQCKAVAEMGATACAKEVVDSEGAVKHKLDEALSTGGSYILFTTLELNKDQKDERINAIRDKFYELGKDYASTAIIEVYDASMIEGWTNKYVSAIVAVLNWIGKPLDRGFKTWDEWERLPECQDSIKFVVDEFRTKAMIDLRELLNTQQKCARIIGLSGMGKTRLAFEAFRDVEELSDYGKRVVYVDAKSNKSITGLVSDWIRQELQGILVVDNCDIKLHKALKKEVMRSDSKLSLLTLDYNLEKDSNSELIHLKPFDNNHIKMMLEPIYGEKIEDLDRIISFAQGFPKMAVLLAEARLDKEIEMGSLTDDDLVHKLLWGDNQRQPDIDKILTGCALFDRFGLEDEAKDEYEFIAENIVGVDLDTFYSCVKRFEERGIIDRRGRYASLVPKPLAIRLAAEWWRTTRLERQIELIDAKMPGLLIDSFCNQTSRLDFLPEVKNLTEKLCGSQGPFGQAEVILSDRGSRLFRALVEVNPEATSKVLFGILQKFSEDDLKNIKGDGRRNLVMALEKLCFHSSCFDISAKSLLLLASSENENWSNNATGIFKQLFNTFLSGTEAPPSLRLNVIDDALKSKSDSIRKLAVDALEAAISLTGGTRSIGAEYQGSGEPLKEWRPKIWGEAYKYWDEILNRLLTLAIEEDDLAKDAKLAIAQNIRSLMSYGRVDILDKIINIIVKKDGPLWPEALENIKDIIRFDSKEIPKEGKEKLDRWVELLTPTDLKNRLLLIVTRPPYEHEKDVEGHYEDVSARNAINLAKEIAEDVTQLMPFLSDLLKGEQRQTYLFGKTLVESTGKWEPLFTESMNIIGKVEMPNIYFILGLLNGLFLLDPKGWEEKVELFFDNKILNKYYARALTTGKRGEKQLNNVIKLIKEKKVEANIASEFTYGRALDDLTPEIVTKFCKELAFISDETAWIAIDILFMYCYQDSNKWNSCVPTFKEIVIKLKLEESEKSRSDVYHWSDAVKKLLKIDDPDFAISVTSQILLSTKKRMSYGDLWHYVQPIIRILFKKYSKAVWPYFSDAIISASNVEQYKIAHLLNSGNSFNKKSPSVLTDLAEDIFQEWCLKYPDIAPEFVAETTEVLLEDGEKYKFSERAKFLLDNFGNNKNVLATLSGNMSSFGWSGSLVPYLKKEIEVLESLKEHRLSQVRDWALDRIDYLNNTMKRENIRDEEHDWGIY